MQLRLDKVKNPLIVARWQEVIDHRIAIVEARADDLDEGFAVLHLDQTDAQRWGIYPVLSISDMGTVAEYSTNQPFHYPTFSELLTAASVRTAAT